MVHLKEHRAVRHQAVNRLQGAFKQAGKSRFNRTVLRLKRFCAVFFMRLLELSVAVPVTVFAALPIYMYLSACRLITGKDVFVYRHIVGTRGRNLAIRYFNVKWHPIRCIALCFPLLSGRLALVGRSLTDWHEHSIHPENRYLTEMKPGIFSLWQVRKNSRIHHEGQIAAEWEYRFTQGGGSDVLLLLRAVSSSAFATNATWHADSMDLFGVTMANRTMKGAVQLIDEALTAASPPRSVFFVNPDCLNKTFHDAEYMNVLRKADLIFPDGIGLVIAGKILGTPLKENVNGTDMLPYLCELAAKNGKKIYLVGGKDGVARAMKNKLEQKYGSIIAGCHHGYFNREQESRLVIEKINDSGAEIVLVAFGAPLQEKWITDNRAHFDAKVVMGVGGLFDFYSGNTKRAPRWLRELGLEWVYRIIQEPGRMWRRYIIGNPLFLWRVLRWKMSLKK